MAFVVKIFFLSAIVYGARAGLLSGAHSADSYAPTGLSAPSASYGPPSSSYGAPPIDHHSSGGLLEDASHGGHSHGGDIGGPIDSGSLLDSPHIGGGPSGPHAEGSLIGSPVIPGPSGGGAAIGGPRVIGQTVTVGRPTVTRSRYELEAVVQNIVRRVPVEVTKHIQVAVPQPYPVPVRQEVKVPVPQPYPVKVEVTKHVPYPVYKTQHVEVERPVPYEVVRQVPFEVIRKVHVPVERPYEVIKKIHVPIEKHVEVPVAVWKPYPIHIIKHVTHYKKKCGHCGW